MLDWSSTNKVTVALTDDVFIWNPDTKETSKILSLSSILYARQDENLFPNEAYVTSVKWMDNGIILAVGTSDNRIILWDLIGEKCIHIIDDHCSRVSALAWNGNVLSSGSYLGDLYNHDFRFCDKISSLEFHMKQICGLKWNSNGRYLCSGAGKLGHN